jgi:transcriptional regulator with XRE-family HTH domain
VLSLRELSRLAGVTHDAILEIEQGKRRPHPATIRKLAAGLGVDPGELILQSRRAVLSIQDAIDTTEELRSELGPGWHVTASQGTNELCVKIERAPVGPDATAADSAEFCGSDVYDAADKVRRFIAAETGTSPEL